MMCIACVCALQLQSSSSRCEGQPLSKVLKVCPAFKNLGIHPLTLGFYVCKQTLTSLSMCHWQEACGCWRDAHLIMHNALPAYYCCAALSL